MALKMDSKKYKGLQKIKQKAENINRSSIYEKCQIYEDPEKSDNCFQLEKSQNSSDFTNSISREIQNSKLPKSRMNQKNIYSNTPNVLPNKERNKPNKNVNNKEVPKRITNTQNKREKRKMKDSKITKKGAKTKTQELLRTSMSKADCRDVHEVHGHKTTETYKENSQRKSPPARNLTQEINSIPCQDDQHSDSDHEGNLPENSPIHYVSFDEYSSSQNSHSSFHYQKDEELNTPPVSPEKRKINKLLTKFSAMEMKQIPRSISPGEVSQVLSCNSTEDTAANTTSTSDGDFIADMFDLTPHVYHHRLRTMVHEDLVLGDCKTLLDI